MSKLLNLTLLTSLLLCSQLGYTQEWKNLKDYKKSTGVNELQAGCWLTKDRTKNTETWKRANAFNLSLANGNLKYETISQKRDFYSWFDAERIKLGHEIKIIGVAAMVAGQLSKFENGFICAVIVRNKEVVWFANEGSTKVFEYAFPQMKEVYFSKHILKQQEAKDWDNKYEIAEQCEIVELVYNQLSDKATQKLERIAKGKGIYNLAVKKKLKFEGKITDCKARYEHAFTKLFPYYIDKKKR